MMRNRILQFSFLLVIFLINLKVLAGTEAADVNPVPSYMTTTEDKQRTGPMELKSSDVYVEIRDAIAEVTVRQRYINSGDTSVDGTYMFPLPEGASVYRMEMVSGDNIFRGELKEKKEAENTFARLKEQGKNATLLNQPSSDMFSMNLANVMPGETVDLVFSYTEIIIPDNKVYEFIFPRKAGAFHTGDTVTESDLSQAAAGNSTSGPDFSIEVNILTNNPLKDVVCISHETDTFFESDSIAKVVLKNITEKENNSDYILDYRIADSKSATGLILSRSGDENFLLLNKNLKSRPLKDLSVRFSDLETYDVEPLTIPDLPAKKPVMLLGKWKGEADGIIEVNGKNGRYGYSKKFRFVKKGSSESKGSLQRVWAGQRLNRLSGDYDTSSSPETKSEINNMGLVYNLVSRETSFLAYNDTVLEPEMPVKHASLDLPAQVTEEEKPAPQKIAKVPEPEFYILVLIMGAVLLTGGLRKKAACMFTHTAGKQDSM